jgi:hypothetical protein
VNLIGTSEAGRHNRRILTHYLPEMRSWLNFEHPLQVFSGQWTAVGNRGVEGGDTIVEHHKRFRPGGAYDHFGLHDYILLDFRTSTPTVPQRGN